MICERFPQVVHGESEFFFRNETIPIAIEDPEGVKDILLHPSVPPQHHVDELVEVDRVVAVLVHVPDHVLQLTENNLIKWVSFFLSAIDVHWGAGGVGGVTSCTPLKDFYKLVHKYTIKHKIWHHLYFLTTPKTPLKRVFTSLSSHPKLWSRIL